MRNIPTVVLGYAVLAGMSSCGSSFSDHVTDRSGESSGSGSAGSVISSCIPLKVGAFMSVVHPSLRRPPAEIDRVPDVGTKWSWVVARYAGRGTAAWLVGPPGVRHRVYAGDRFAQILTVSAPSAADAPITPTLAGTDAAACLWADAKADQKLLNEDLPSGFE